jgi:hypothetical protein
MANQPVEIVEETDDYIDFRILGELIIFNQLNDPKLRFLPKSHTYKYNKQKLVSVTTWLDQFDPPFTSFKKTAFYKNSSKETKAEWKAVGDEGTAVHAQIEDYIKFDSGPLNLYKPTLARAKLGVTEYNKLKSRFNPTDIHVEARVFSLQMGVAGTVDLIFETPEGLVIIDWKTNRSLSGKIPNPEGKREQSVYTLPDTKMAKYTMQLNTYAYILETYYGYKIRALKLVHLEETEAKVMDLPYIPSLVQELVECGPIKYTYRADGRVEITCEHGVGHTTYASAVKCADENEEYLEGNCTREECIDAWMSHGCDGCCKKYKECQDVNKK